MELPHISLFVSDGMACICSPFQRGFSIENLLLDRIRRWQLKFESNLGTYGLRCLTYVSGTDVRSLTCFHDPNGPIRWVGKGIVRITKTKNQCEIAHFPKDYIAKDDRLSSPVFSEPQLSTASRLQAPSVSLLRPWLPVTRQSLLLEIPPAVEAALVKTQQFGCYPSASNTILQNQRTSIYNRWKYAYWNAGDLANGPESELYRDLCHDLRSKRRSRYIDPESILGKASHTIKSQSLKFSFSKPNLATKSSTQAAIVAVRKWMIV